MGIGNTGWEAIEDSGNTGPGTGSSYGPRRFFVPANVTKRIMFLDDSPYTLYEHSLWALTKSGKDRAVCLKKNRSIGEDCPLCDAELWPSFVGFFSIIDFGDVKQGKKKGDVVLEGWTSDKGVTYQFGTKLLGAKRGGKDKPGILRKLERLKDKKKGLVGTVWDVYRSGSKVESVGDEWEYVETVEPSKWKEYLVGQGASEETLDLSPVDYDTAFTVPDVDYLRGLVGGSAPQKTFSKESSIPVTSIEGDDDPDFEEAL